jgi:NAD(P)-dependent dehydrogenase (short-subunit alcohol dehydrogenase family)
MVLDLRGKKVVVIGGKQSVGAAIFEAVAREGADVVIWLRKCINGVDEANVLPITQLKVPSQLLNGAAPTSLWRQTMGHKSYW